MSPNLNNPKDIADTANRIYEELYKADFELNHPGKFVAINVLDKSGTVGDTATSTLMEARARHPLGFFHLIRVGYPGAFEIGFSRRYVSPDRLY